MTAKWESWLFGLLAVCIAAAAVSLGYLVLGQPESEIRRKEEFKSKVLADLASLQAAAEKFGQENGRYPSSLEELTPVYIVEAPKDPWGREYVYSSKEERRSIATYGKDGAPGKHPWFDFETIDSYVFLAPLKVPEKP